MFSRLIYYFYFAVVAAVIAVKWNTLPDEMRLLEQGNLQGYLSLGQLVLLLLMCYLVTVALRRTGKSRGGRRAHTGIYGTLRQMPIDSRTAFTRHPVWTSVLLLIMAGIPVALVALVHGGNLRSLGAGNWVLVGIVELPIAYAISVTLAGIRSSRDGRR